MKHKKIYLSVLFAYFAICGNSQTVVWQMQPTDYNFIERINNNLYIVKRNDKIGLINADGSIVADVVNDNLTGFYEHKALLTQNDGTGERVMGCLTDDGHYSPFSKKYYLLSGQNFFSDGVLTVSNEKGQKGYIDESGNVVVGFDGKFDKIKPFVEGYAAVFKNNKYFLIDKDGVPARFLFDGVGELYGGTNAFKGKVYVWDTSGTFYTYDIANGNQPCKKIRRPQNYSSCDYLYRISSVSNMTKEIPFVNKKKTGTMGLKPIVTDNLYGFVNNSKIVLPCQLSGATQFEDNYSIAVIDGRIGILRWVDGEGFAVSYPTETKEFFMGNNVTCSFTLSIPSVWRGKNLSVVVKDSNGSSVVTTNVVNTYSFDITPKDDTTCEYSIAVYAERLRLFDGTVSYGIVRKCDICKKDWKTCRGIHQVTDNKKTEKKQEKCPTCGKPIEECAKRGVH